MKHAFLIMAHKNFKQLGILVKLLDHPENDIYVHIDLKADFSESDAAELTKNAHYSRIIFVPRMNVSWGGYSQIGLELLLLQEAIRSQHDYYHLLSGQDLPIVSQTSIDDFFTRHRGAEFIGILEDQRRNTLSDITKERYSLYHPFQERLGRKDLLDERLLIPIQRRLRVDRVKRCKTFFAKGANWFSITDSFAHYVVQQKSWISKTFSNTQCCDEVFLQTLLINSPFIDKLYIGHDGKDNNSIMRYIDWTHGNPYVFRSSDYDRVMSSGMLFARKFDEQVDDAIIRRIAATLSYQSRSER